MITNKRQYERAVKSLGDLKEIISEINDVVSKESDAPVELKLQLNSSYRQMEKLQKQIKRYETLMSDNLAELEFDSYKDDLNDAIMSFRIASKLTQTKIAELLYVKSQQIQRYERDGYRTMSFERILELLEALDVQLVLRKEFNKPFNYIIDTSNISHYIDDVNVNKQLLKISESI